MPRSRYIKCSLHADKLSVVDKAMLNAMGITLGGDIDVHGPNQTLLRGGRIGRNAADGELGGEIVLHCRSDLEITGNNVRHPDYVRVRLKSRKSKKRKICIVEIIEPE